MHVIVACHMKLYSYFLRKKKNIENGFFYRDEETGLYLKYTYLKKKKWRFWWFFLVTSILKNCIYLTPKCRYTIYFWMQKIVLISTRAFLLKYIQLCKKVCFRNLLLFCRSKNKRSSKRGKHISSGTHAQYVGHKNL